MRRRDWGDMVWLSVKLIWFLAATAQVAAASDERLAPASRRAAARKGRGGFFQGVGKIISSCLLLFPDHLNGHWAEYAAHATQRGFLGVLGKAFNPSPAETAANNYVLILTYIL